MKGIVTHYNDDSGYGFILGNDGERYFVHFSKILIRKPKVLFKDEYVNFDISKVKDKEKNDQAINVKPTNPEKKNQITLHKNPFNLGPVNKPENFAGRKNLIKEGVTALLNNNNLLIYGNRGMGKSSLANQFYYIAKGNNFLINKLNISFFGTKKLEYGVISIRSFKDSTINDIAANIIRELIKKYDLTGKADEDLDIDMDLYKLKLKTFTSEMSSENLLDFFYYDIINIYNYLKFKNGILILIDEIENIDPDTGFAGFIKNVTEYFATEGKKINFILSGIQSSITNLFFQHPSFLRLFTPLEVKELSIVESFELVDFTFKNSHKIIKKNAKPYLGKISRGFPSNLQLIGYYSFQTDHDDIITKEDINEASSYIIKNVKKNEFDSKHEKIGYGNPEEILKKVVVELKGEISHKNMDHMFEEFGKTETMSAISCLTDLEILHRVTKGTYFIRDQLFFMYLKDYYRN